jgi:hypothetical protein
MYEALINVVDDAFHRMQKRTEIEHEIGLIFRSKHFNMYKRNNQQPRWAGGALPLQQCGI